jgi:uncharacterized membrane protein YgdD (TMEM256/DUF423 family)
MERIFLILGALSAFMGVAAGAFGAHGLKSRFLRTIFLFFATGFRERSR